MFMKHLNQPLRNNKSGNHGNNDDESVTPSDAVATEAEDEASPAVDDSDVDIEIILPDYPRSRPNTKSAKFSDVDIVNLSPGAYLFVLPSFHGMDHQCSVLFCRSVTYPVYTAAWWVIYAILLTYIDTICRLAMELVITLAPGEECEGNTFGSVHPPVHPSVCLYVCPDKSYCSD